MGGMPGGGMPGGMPMGGMPGGGMPGGGMPMGMGGEMPPGGMPGGGMPMGGMPGMLLSCHAHRCCKEGVGHACALQHGAECRTPGWLNWLRLGTSIHSSVRKCQAPVAHMQASGCQFGTPAVQMHRLMQVSLVKL